MEGYLQGIDPPPKPDEGLDDQALEEIRDEIITACEDGDMSILETMQDADEALSGANVTASKAAGRAAIRAFNVSRALAGMARCMLVSGMETRKPKAMSGQYLRSNLGVVREARALMMAAVSADKLGVDHMVNRTMLQTQNPAREAGARKPNSPRSRIKELQGAAPSRPPY